MVWECIYDGSVWNLSHFRMSENYLSAGPLCRTDQDFNHPLDGCKNKDSPCSNTQIPGLTSAIKRPHTGPPINA